MQTCNTVKCVSKFAIRRGGTTPPGGLQIYKTKDGGPEDGPRKERRKETTGHGPKNK